MELENLTVKELQSLCIELGLKKSGTKTELIHRISEHAQNKESREFSFGGFIAAVLFAYIAYNFYPFVIGFDNLVAYLHSGEIFPTLILDFLVEETEGKFSDGIKFFRFWFWLVLISYASKSLFCFYHVFSPTSENANMVLIWALVLEVLPVVIKVWSESGIIDAVEAGAFVSVPTMFALGLMRKW